MLEINKTEEINKLIEITKSNSGVSGPELCKAHIRLGELLAENINVDPNDTTVVAIMRGGIFFAQGIYFKLNCKFKTFDPKNEDYIRPNTKYVIIVDSVINTGNTLLNFIDENTIVACNVINEQAVNKFKDRLYSIRVSSNSYVGKEIKIQKGNIGPDTTARLFNII